MVNVDGMVACKVVRNDQMRGQMDLEGCAVKDYERIHLHLEESEDTPSPAQQMGKNKQGTGKIFFFTFFINTLKTWI